ncbi:hypothetical protein B0H13DRAFT_2314365 [Mycena leptocephala]|nr:hypothetical protein B0H13DRAFT_2314365 [Mycena leptocephala]
MKLIFTSIFLAIAQLAAAQVTFHWRLYNNGGCDHSSPATATFPPIPGSARDGVFDVCVTAPQGIAWNRIEVDTSVDLFTFCGANCRGSDLETVGISCNSAPAGCVLNSFLAFPL